VRTPIGKARERRRDAEATGLAKRINAYLLQARLSVALAICGAAFCLALAFGVATAFDPDMGVIYRSGGPRHYAILVTTFIAFSASAIGFSIGLNSADRKTNPSPRLSWVGFFMNAGVLTATLCVFAFFWFMRWGVVE
jgi:hypothetical protein